MGDEKRLPQCRGTPRAPIGYRLFLEKGFTFFCGTNGNLWEPGGIPQHYGSPFSEYCLLFLPY